MSDGIQTNYLFILNGDSEERHLNNESKTREVALEEGLPEENIFQIDSIDKFKKIVGGLASKMDNDDRYVVHVTGHGSLTEGVLGEPCLVLKDGCLSYSEIKKKMEPLQYGSRFFYMDACQSGGAFPLFANDKTRFLSLGAKGENVACQTYTPYFWNAPDADDDGVTTLGERMEHAKQNGALDTVLQFFNPGHDESIFGEKPEKSSIDRLVERVQTKEEGVPEVSLKGSKEYPVLEVHNEADLAWLRNELGEQAVALVTISAYWCEPCKEYAPKFEQIAKEYEGRFLMVRFKQIEGNEVNWDEIKQKYKMNGWPHVAFMDRNKMEEVADRDNPIDSLKLFAMTSEEERLDFYVDKLALEIEKMREDLEVTASLYRAIADLAPFGEKIARRAAPILKELLEFSNSPFGRSSANVALKKLVVMTLLELGAIDQISFDDLAVLNLENANEVPIVRILFFYWMSNGRYHSNEISRMLESGEEEQMRALRYLDLMGSFGKIGRFPTEIEEKLIEVLKENDNLVVSDRIISILLGNLGDAFNLVYITAALIESPLFKKREFQSVREKILLIVASQIAAAFGRLPDKEWRDYGSKMLGSLFEFESAEVSLLALYVLDDAHLRGRAGRVFLDVRDFRNRTKHSLVKLKAAVFVAEKSADDLLPIEELRVLSREKDHIIVAEFFKYLKFYSAEEVKEFFPMMHFWLDNGDGAVRHYLLDLLSGLERDASEFLPELSSMADNLPVYYNSSGIPHVEFGLPFSLAIAIASIKGRIEDKKYLRKLEEKIEARAQRVDVPTHSLGLLWGKTPNFSSEVTLNYEWRALPFLGVETALSYQYKRSEFPVKGMEESDKELEFSTKLRYYPLRDRFGKSYNWSEQATSGVYLGSLGFGEEYDFDSKKMETIFYPFFTGLHVYVPYFYSALNFEFGLSVDGNNAPKFGFYWRAGLSASF